MISLYYVMGWLINTPSYFDFLILSEHYDSANTPINNLDYHPKNLIIDKGLMQVDALITLIFVIAFCLEIR